MPSSPICKTGVASEATTLHIKVVDSGDPSVQCIAAIRQVMEEFQTPVGGLSANGKDIRAVYAWFVERYNPDVRIQVKP